MGDAEFIYSCWSLLAGAIAVFTLYSAIVGRETWAIIIICLHVGVNYADSIYGSRDTMAYGFIKGLVSEKANETAPLSGKVQSDFTESCKTHTEAAE